jgi:hypothetical protein
MQGMRKTGVRTVNVYCGAVYGNGKRASGCGAKPKSSGFNEYAYNPDGYKSLWSTVSLCPKCEARVIVMLRTSSGAFYASSDRDLKKLKRTGLGNLGYLSLGLLASHVAKHGYNVAILG